MVVSKENKSKMIFGIIVGVLYLVFGFIQFFVGLSIRSELTDSLFIPNDVIGGLILVLIGIVFLFGVKELNEGLDEGVAYIYVGILLALVFMIIYSLIIVANAINTYVLVNEDFSDWTPLDDMRPGIYLGVIPIIGILIWRSRFTLTRKKNEKKR
jgi:hypothetical protein